MDHQVAITICDWGNWIHGGTCLKLDQEIDSLVGGAKAHGALKTYDGCFKMWAHFRDLQNKSFLIDQSGNKQLAELDLLTFATLQFGPLQKKCGYCRAIFYVNCLCAQSAIWNQTDGRYA